MVIKKNYDNRNNENIYIIIIKRINNKTVLINNKK